MEFTFSVLWPHTRALKYTKRSKFESKLDILYFHEMILHIPNLQLDLRYQHRTLVNYCISICIVILSLSFVTFIVHKLNLHLYNIL